jgi:hypothetical protein
MCGYLISIKSPLTWSGGPLYENENFWPCRSQAQDQLPRFSAPCLTPNIPFFPPCPRHTCEHLISSTTSTCLNLLLSGSPSMLCSTLYCVCCCREGVRAQNLVSMSSSDEPCTPFVAAGRVQEPGLPSLCPVPWPRLQLMPRTCVSGKKLIMIHIPKSGFNE